MLKRMILVLALAAMIAAMVTLGGGPAIAAKAGDLEFGSPEAGEADPSCKGIVTAAKKSGREELKTKTGELNCGPGVPPKV